MYLVLSIAVHAVSVGYAVTLGALAHVCRYTFARGRSTRTARSVWLTAPRSGRYRPPAMFAMCFKLVTPGLALGSLPTSDYPLPLAWHGNPVGTSNGDEPTTNYSDLIGVMQGRSEHRLAHGHAGVVAIQQHIAPFKPHSPRLAGGQAPLESAVTYIVKQLMLI